MTHAFSLRARWVLPIDRPPIRDGVVSIRNDRIEGIEPWSSESGPVEDLGDVAILPGLVNAHTHLEFSDQQQPLGKPSTSLPEWIRLVISDRKRSNRDAQSTIAQGLQESLRAGVTTLGEIATSPADSYSSGQLHNLIAFQEVIGFSAARIDSMLAEVTDRIDGWPTPKAVGISPHAPYTVHPQLLAELVDLALKRSCPVAMHLAESPEELELLLNNSGPFRELLEERSMWDDEAIPLGSRPLDYLKMLSHAPRALVIHGNYLDEDEISYVAERRANMSVVYCPRTHAYFGHPRYPLPEMLETGVSMAIGTDSRASNPDLNLWSELRFIARSYTEIAPEKILELGTLSGAKALGLGGEVGSLTPGKLANLLAIECSDEQDPGAALLMSESVPTKVWLRGKEVASSY